MGSTPSFPSFVCLDTFFFPMGYGLFFEVYMNLALLLYIPNIRGGKLYYLSNDIRRAPYTFPPTNKKKKGTKKGVKKKNTKNKTKP